MKRVISIVAMLATMVMMASCGSPKSPEEVVERCWEQLSKGNLEEALELFAITEQERPTYLQLYADVCRSLEVAGGVDEVVIVGSSVGEAEATVEATVTLHSGQQLTQTYSLVKVEKEWKLDK